MTIKAVNVKTIVMSGTASVNTATIQEWIANKFDQEKIARELMAQGLDESAISVYLKEFRRIKNARKQFTGFICLGAGAFLGFISCVLTLTNPIPELFNIILYGLTSIAILIICVGLYFVLE